MNETFTTFTDFVVVVILVNDLASVQPRRILSCAVRTVVHEAISFPNRACDGRAERGALFEPQNCSDKFINLTFDFRSVDDGTGTRARVHGRPLGRLRDVVLQSDCQQLA